MIYLDYAAHTPACKEALDTFYEIENSFLGNPNSSHSLGLNAKNRLDDASRKISEILNLSDCEIIYTSGATESNNLAIKGVPKKGKHIITTYLEHSSVTGSIIEMQNQGFEVDFVDIKNDGQVDVIHLKELLRNDTAQVSICYVDSEVGTLQNIKEIGEILKKYPNCCFHVDATQAVGKIPVDFENVDLATFSAHKFFGICGIGCLIKKKDIILSPIISGGISTSPFRSGTPTLSLIVSMEKALSLSNLDTVYIKELNTKIKNHLKTYNNVYINSPENSIPHILNISFKGAREMHKKLDEEGIYLSMKSACCAVNAPSRPVLAVTKDKKRALSTLRISLSHKTTVEEVDAFLKTFDRLMKG